MTGVICYIGIGSNIGDALRNCKDAVNVLSGKSGIKLARSSSFYLSEPVGIENQGWFVNAVVEISTTLPVRELLMVLQSIENEMGRTREIRGGPRVIDLDLLFYGQNIINEPDLKVPHPELHKRCFVLKPLCEIASYFIHPCFCISARGLKERCPDKKIVKCITPKIPICLQ